MKAAAETWPRSRRTLLATGSYIQPWFSNANAAIWLAEPLVHYLSATRVQLLLIVFERAAFFFIFLSFGETLRQKWKIIFLKANGRSSLKSLKKRPSIGQTRCHWDYLTYQYQMPVVEDLVADCASIASVHIQFWDPSHHEKPDARKTAMKCEIAYLGKTLQGLLHRTKFSLTQQHNQLYLYSLDFTISRWRIHITFKAYSVKLSWKRESKVHRIRHHCQYSICLFLDLEVTSSPEWELNDELQTRVAAVSIMPGWILWSQNCNWKLQTSTVLKWLIKYAN